MGLASFMSKPAVAGLLSGVNIGVGSFLDRRERDRQSQMDELAQVRREDRTYQRQRDTMLEERTYQDAKAREAEAKLKASPKYQADELALKAEQQKAEAYNLAGGAQGEAERLQAEEQRKKDAAGRQASESQNRIANDNEQRQQQEEGRRKIEAAQKKAAEVAERVAAWKTDFQNVKALGKLRDPAELERLAAELLFKGIEKSDTADEFYRLWYNPVVNRKASDKEADLMNPPAMPAVGGEVAQPSYTPTPDTMQAWQGLGSGPRVSIDSSLAVRGGGTAPQGDSLALPAAGDAQPGQPDPVAQYMTKLNPATGRMFTRQEAQARVDSLMAR